VRDRKDQAVIDAWLWLLQRNAVFSLSFLGVGPRLVDIYLDAVRLKLAHDVDHSRIAQIRTVLLEGQSENQHARTTDRNVLLDQRLYELLSHVFAHAVVDAPAR